MRLWVRSLDMVASGDLERIALVGETANGYACNESHLERTRGWFNGAWWMTRLSLLSCAWPTAVCMYLDLCSACACDGGLVGSGDWLVGL